MRCAMFLLIAAVLAAQDPVTFRSDVALVHVDLEVTDGTRVLSGFHKEDFVVRDNGRSEQVLYFSQEEEPLDVVLLFDISGSMKPKIEKLADSAHAALAELRPGDRVAIMTFHGSSRLIAPLSSDLEAVQRSIFADVIGGRFGGGTRLLAGVDDAAKYFLAQPQEHRRRAVLILTDNYGQRSRRSSTVVHRLWEADALLSGLIIRTGVDTARAVTQAVSNPLMYELMREGMDVVADKTGGETLKSDDPGSAFREMMHRIRVRYSLYYAMPKVKPGEERQVKVDLSRETLDRFPTARVRSRKGYIAPPA
jgi:VWFA-related protein